jgi:hypothetical protein
MTTFRCLFLLALILTAANAARAQAPSCGTMPCIAVLSDVSQKCGTYDIPPAVDLVNHAGKGATVTLKMNDGGAPTTGNYEIGPNTKIFLGCSGSTLTGKHVSWGVVSVKWH